MSERIINLQTWLQTPAGQALCQWEQTQMDEWVADAFGYHALQLGLLQWDALRSNRMPQRWHVALSSEAPPPSDIQPDFIADPVALPFSEASIDLIAMPHTLECSQDAHASLREAARVLVPEGRVIVTGFNPRSLWNWSQKPIGLGRAMRTDPLAANPSQDLISPGRLRDWLKLLGFEIESVRYGLWSPAVSSQAAFERLQLLNELGQRYWPILGAAYGFCAVKRIRGMKRLQPSWKRSAPRAASPIPLAPRTQQNSTRNEP